MDAGDWFGTEQLARLCLYNGCVTWPRYVGTVLGVRLCGHQVEIKNSWWNIIGNASRCGWAYGQRGWVNYPQLLDTGQACTYNDISGTGKPLRVYPVKLEDVGKTVTFFGTDSNGQPLQQKINGAWQMGVTVTLALPYVQTTQTVRQIDSVVKDSTQGNVLLYEYDAATDTLRDLALYEPGETNPRYRRSHFKHLCVKDSRCEDANGDKIRRIEAIIKLAFVPLVNDYDFLLIDNFLALKFMLQCIRAEEAGDAAKGGGYEAKAIRQMNLRDRNQTPPYQSSIRVNPVGTMLVNPI